MKNLSEVQENFQDNLKMVEQIVNIGSDVGNLLVGMLEDLKEKNEPLSGFLPYKEKIERTIGMVKMIKDDSRLKSKYEIIRNQAVVLVVENFESFLNDCVKTLVNEYPGAIKWPEKKKVLPVNTDVLRYSIPTVGDLVVASLKKEEVNFQDLQSMRRFFKDYLEFDIILEGEERDRIVFAHALRNIVVHNGNAVDSGFLSQVRDTRYSKKYKDKEKILLSEEEYLAIIGGFSRFSETVIGGLQTRVSADATVLSAA